MKMFLLIILVSLFVELIPLFYILIRNEWVCRKRLEVLRESSFDGKNLIPYDNLPPYDEMLSGHGFWRWDVEYYLPKDNRQ